MCQYCKQGKTLLEKDDAVSSGEVAFVGNSINIHDFEYRLGLFIDRGYLRVVDLDDCQCIDNGEKIKINFCPICGNEIN